MNPGLKEITVLFAPTDQYYEKYYTGLETIATFHVLTCNMYLALPIRFNLEFKIHVHVWHVF